MCVATRITAVLVLAVSIPGPAMAHDEGATAAVEASGEPALHMPGDRGEEGAPVRIHRGAGLAPLPVSAPRSGVMGDASRPVTVTDEFIENARRVTEPRGWGVFGRTTLSSSKRYYIGHIGHFGKKKRAKHRRHDRVDHRAPHRSKRRYGRHHRKWGRAKGFGSGVLVRSSNVKLWVGF